MPMVRFLKQYHVSLLLALVFSVYFFFALGHLGKFITADEHYWVYERIPEYWNAVTDGKWSKTYINDKPGVSLALVTGASLLPIPHPETLCGETAERIITCNPTKVESALFTFRLLLVTFNALLLLFLFWIIKKITTTHIALWSTAFMALSPILLGISQILNPDALLWSFGSASLFFYFALLRFQEKKYLFFSGIFLGLAILSKYTASFFLPFFLLISILSLYFRPITDFTSILNQVQKNLKHFFFVFCITVTTVVFFLPAIWLKPAILINLLSGGTDIPFIFVTLTIFVLLSLDSFFFRGYVLHFFHTILKRAQRIPSLPYILPWGTLGLMVLLLLGRMMFPDWSLFVTTPFDAKDLTSTYNGANIAPHFFESLLLEINPVVFSLTPITLLFFSFFLFRLPTLKRETTPWHFELWITLLFLPIFIFLLIFLDVLATPRYAIALYPLIAFLSASGLWEALSGLKQRWPKYDFLNTINAALLLIVVSGISLLSSYPFYFNYTNALLPKQSLISDAWGYGGYEAAQYLNSLPNAQNLLVWTDYEGVCEFFVGKCMVKQYKYSSKQPIDYAVVTRRGGILYNPNHSRWTKEGNLSMKQAYDNPNPDWQLAIHNRPGNFIKVVKVDNVLDVAIVTDIDHCPSRSAVSEEQLQSFITFSQMKGSDFIVSLGDNASHRLRDCSATGDADARYIAKRLRSSGLPVHLSLGDHDISSSVTSYNAWLETIGREKTYYSFHENGVHVIVLDTVLGGDPIRMACQDEPHCAEPEARLADMKTLSYPEYQKKYLDALSSRPQELRLITKQWETAKQEIALTRSFGNRDRGRIGTDQLAWLEADISATPLEKILILSDHPLFPFTSDKKRYDIVDGEKVRSILEKSGKEVVAISGEAHVWHEETVNGIRYYIIDEFRKQNSSWAHFSWDDQGFRLEQITH